jgi:hypothetical protein
MWSYSKYLNKSIAISVLKLEVLILQETKSNWQAVKKGLKLVPEDNDDIK